MSRIFFFTLLLASLLTGAAFWGGGLSSALVIGPDLPEPTIDAGCEWDPNGRPICTPGS